MKPKKDISQEQLRSAFYYSPLLGQFFHRVERRGTPAWSRAGTSNGNGYRKLNLAGGQFFEHRLVWLYVYGVWPEKVIDHINGIPDDNRLVNLRAVTQAENQLNRPLQRNNTSGYRGVCAFQGRWKAQIKRNGRATHIGMFATPELAHAAFLAAGGRS